MSTSENLIRKRNKRKVKNKIRNCPERSVDENWSDTKIHDELSSFIAEFSYFEDAQDLKEDRDVPILRRRPSQSYHVYPAQKHHKNPIRFKSDSQLKKRQRFRKRKNKSIEWRELNSKPTPPCDIDKSRDDIQFIEVRRSSDIDNKYLDDIQFIEVRKSRSQNRWRRVNQRADKTKNKPQFRRARSEHKKIGYPFKITKSQDFKPRRRSRSCSNKRYMPFRYERRKKSSTKTIYGKKPPLHAIELKVPKESPTIITLYPQNPGHIDVINCDAKLLTDRNLPCKCPKCIKKMKFVKSISRKPKYKMYPTFEDRPPVPPVTFERNPYLAYGNPYSKLPPCLPMAQHCERLYPQFPYWPNRYRQGFPRCFNNRGPPCISPFTIYSDCTDYEDCFTNQCMNSFSLRCNTFGQPINSAITHYFHSILNKQFSCC